MICPMKFNSLPQWGYSWMGTDRENGVCECEKEECAWWVWDKKTEEHHKAHGTFDESACAIKLIGEK